MSRVNQVDAPLNQIVVGHGITGRNRVRMRGVRGWTMRHNDWQQTLGDFRDFAHPPDTGRNPSDCVDRRAALQRNVSQRFPQG